MSHQMFALVTVAMNLPILIVVAGVEWWRDRPDAQLAKALEEFHEFNARRESDHQSHASEEAK